MLLTRVLSSVGLLAPALAALYWGGYLFPALVAVFAAAMVWEWLHLCGAPRTGPAGLAMLAVLLAAAACASFGLWAWALGLVPAAAAAGAGLAAAAGQANRLWIGAGAVYIGLPVLALIWLRADPALGFETVLWLIATVVATDVGAYAIGSTVGGPRLAPTISPGKTWAGLVGGVVCAAVVGYAGAHWLDRISPWALARAGAGMALVAQAGDLAESRIKRHFGVKDTSAIIPGHGGLFDRVDGLIAAAVAAAAWRLISGRSILEWL